MIEPVTTPLASDSSKIASRATSSTWPSLPIGNEAPAWASQSSSAPWNRRWIWSSPSVSVQPMLIPLILILSQRCAWAAFFVSPIRPALAATYGAR